MILPVRLQLLRRKGFNLQESSRAVNGLPAVNVTRPGKWGNPWKIGDIVQRFSAEKICETFTIETSAQACDCLRKDYENSLANPKAAPYVLAALEDLRGKNLACWCNPYLPCHADILLELANKP